MNIDNMHPTIFRASKYSKPRANAAIFFRFFFVRLFRFFGFSRVAVCFLWSLFFFVSPLYAHPFDEHPFVAKIDVSRWQADGNPFECKLWQNVPNFGQALFKARAGENLRFYLVSERRFTQSGVGKLDLSSPDWRYDEPESSLGNISVEKGLKPVVLSADLASHFITALQHGQFPRFTLPGWYKNEQIVVEVSAVNFPQGYKEYIKCLTELLPANFQQMEHSLVLFDTDKTEIKPEFEERLEWVWQYMKADPLVLVRVNGHTDDIGKNLYNWHLSRRRAESIKDYLVLHGVEAERITTDYFGESKPAASNRNQKGRYKNRRTLMRLEKVKAKEDFARIQDEIAKARKIEVPEELKGFLKKAPLEKEKIPIETAQ